MRSIKYILGLSGLSIALLAIFFILKNENTLVVHPKGVIASKELFVIVRNILLMLIVVGPTLVLLFIVAWKYRFKSTKLNQNLEYVSHGWGEWVLWVIPSIIIAIMAFLTWEDTHHLDPYQPLKSDVKPLQIQVVALNWKWLFIYPEQGIATLNFVQFPAQTPIQFSLVADDSPMNSFWIPQLSGQIYAMTGMVTPLHLMADEPSEYSGRAAEINGKGYAGMTFIVKSTLQSDFDAWVNQVKQSPLRLTDSLYQELTKHSENHSILLYSYVEKDLFSNIVGKYLPSTQAAKQ